MNIYVGNLSYDVNDSQLAEMFSPYGQVQTASVVMDRATGRSRGFGFVEMPNADEGKQAIEALHEKDFDGRALKVNEARPKEDRPRGGGERGPSRERPGGGNRQG